MLLDDLTGRDITQLQRDERARAQLKQEISPGETNRDGERSLGRAYLSAYDIGVLERPIEEFLEVRSDRHFSITAHELHIICTIAREFADHSRRASGFAVLGGDLYACDEPLELQPIAISKLLVVSRGKVVRSSVLFVGLDAKG